jgi:hypothetical protein
MPKMILLDSITLESPEAILIKKAYHGYAEIILEKELGGGYSDTRVFRIVPVRRDGARDARMITKIGPAESLRGEYNNYKKRVAPAVPSHMAQILKYCSHDHQAALNYIFVSGGILGQVVSLEEYYHVHTATEINKALGGLLDKALGESWYRQSRPLNRSFREEYSRHLPAHADLEKIVGAVFPNLSAEGNRVQIPGIAGSYPDPLKLYPEVLDTLLEGKLSRVHGDLHPRNLLIDEMGQGWLIDFAKVEDRHNLFDFIKLETYGNYILDTVTIPG